MDRKDFGCCYSLDFSGGTLLWNSERDDSPPLASDVPWVFDRRVQQWRTDAMYYATLCVAIRSDRRSIGDRVYRWKNVWWHRPQLPAPRKEQQLAVDAWYRAGQRGTIVMPTGTGKTEVALQIMLATKTATLVVVPIRELMHQWHRRIMKSLGIDAGLIGDNLYRLAPICVTTYHSARIHMPSLGNRFGLIVFDECHHLPARHLRDAAVMSAAPLRLGLTATLNDDVDRRMDVEQLIGPVVHESSVQSAKGKTLADYQIVRIPVHFTPQERETYEAFGRIVRRYAAKHSTTSKRFDWKAVCRLSNSDLESRRILQAYHACRDLEHRAVEKLRVLGELFQLHRDEQVIVFVGSNAMAIDVSMRYLVPCLLSHSGKRERRDVLDGFANGTFPALVANRVLDEGIDLPDVKIAVVLGGLASTRQAQQRLGRIVRRSGERRATLYEVVLEDTQDVVRFRRRRRNDAYKKVRRRNL
ncbi:MAG: DEAD/DEAH box helicase [Pirellulaceae bacterium]